ncbi:hypothetical protein ES703_18165 [subsurface metagenome]
MTDEETQEVEETEQVGGLITNEEAIEIAEEQGGSREELEAAEETSETKQASFGLKVVIILKDTRAMVGVQAPDCDPIFTTLEGDLAAALAQVSALVESANAKWDANPRYPKAVMPEPPPRPTPARTPAAPATTTPKAQPSFF